ncbi:MAG: molybdopterin-dependent oxidoreductase [Novosphingobium sp.]
MRGAVSADERHLPPGQFAGKAFPRFGLGRFKNKPVAHDGPLGLDLKGLVEKPRVVTAAQLDALERVRQVSDFHCVTTWSIFDVTWEGMRFADFCNAIALPQPDAALVVFHGLDGYRCALPLADLMASDVLLADRMNGAPLGLDHGGPLRLVAPAHYGYKNVKYLAAIEFRKDRRGYRFPFPYPGLMDHPRGRVALEERTQFLPNWLVRPLYKVVVPRAVRK